MTSGNSESEKNGKLNVIIKPMAAVKSDNQFHADMNKYFLMNVFEWSEEKQAYQYAGLYSANGVATYIGNEKLKIKLFNKALEFKTEKYTAFVRKRLKIDFHLK